MVDTENENDVLITVSDVIWAGHCVVPGLRDWCAAHDLSFRTFVQHGYPASVLLKTGDAMAERVVTMKRLKDGR